MRINKYISMTGFCSRRETDRLIATQRITVNGMICEPGTTIEPDDVVLIDGKVIPKKEEPVYLVLNKPVGITCTAAKSVEGNIIDFINYPIRIFPVGRLDKDSKGLIMMTNDGNIVNKMMRSEYGHEKEYEVTVDKPVTDQFLEQLSSGVEILGTITKPCKARKVSEYTYRIILTQGLNRQIRRMAKECGYKVLQLERIRIMNIELKNLPTGSVRELTKVERQQLFLQLN